VKKALPVLLSASACTQFSNKEQTPVPLAGCLQSSFQVPLSSKQETLRIQQIAS